jgi:hypothetical protein
MAMPADLRILISPVVFKVYGTLNERIHFIRTTAAVPFAQTTYHARTREDLQRGTSTRVDDMQVPCCGIAFFVALF